MGFALLGLGLLLVVAGANNTQNDLFTTVKGDFAGPGSFFGWLAALAIIGGVGYVPQLRPISHGFLALIFLVFIVATYRGGHNIFAEFNAAIKGGGTTQTASSKQASNSGIAGTGITAQDVQLAATVIAYA